ncbi:MAG: hypothetical protein AMXMBFR68_16180 [Ignavibacteria bacterium]
MHDGGGGGGGAQRAVVRPLGIYRVVRLRRWVVLNHNVALVLKKWTLRKRRNFPKTLGKSNETRTTVL